MDMIYFDHAATTRVLPEAAQAAVEAICRRPEMAEAIRSFRPQGLGRNKQMVADLVRGGRFGLLTGLYRLKNRM